jgi:hypothetical protein
MKELILLCISINAFLISSSGQVVKETVITDTQFSTLPFGVEVTPSNIQKIVHWKLVQGKKVAPNGTDEIISFKYAGNSFFFLKTKTSYMFYGAEIINAGLKLAKGVEIGISKKVFTKSFGVDSSTTSNKFVVKDELEFCYNDFYFKDEKLVKIVLKGCTD